MAHIQASKNSFNKQSTAEQVTEGVDLSGKTIIVTGIASGLGKEAMRVLALRGAHVLGLDRTMGSAQSACSEVSGITTPFECDLADPNSIIACTDKIKAKFQSLDVILTNAGIMTPPYKVVDKYKESLEIQFAVNFLGHFILINRLMSLVEAAPAGRLALVASEGYATAPRKTGIAFEDLSFSNGYDALTAYGHSKLAVMLISQEYSRRLEGTNITSNSVHPGVIRTNLASDTESFKVKLISMFAGPFTSSIPQGAATHCFVAAHPSLEGVSGQHFADSNPKEPKDHPLVKDLELAGRLWDKAEELADGYLI
ncbi:MAG: SDR family NAD(P)-dependent oxidoreductase [Pseudomonadota bacterium]|nr:SDR family NAD(P)-dependent oxidoreductase [Pseudomonadota bacterium]